ncbi:MAG: class I SAM-dependent methyltransferase [Salibacteraceae bacterium]
MKPPKTNIIIENFSSFNRKNARFRQWFWNLWYNVLAKKYRNLHEWTCMNYGFVQEPLSNPPFELTSKNLYDHVLEGVEIKSTTLLEIGCGRGGGLHHVFSTQAPASATGIDLSKWNISFCNQRFSEPNLSYVEASADELPFEDGQFDIIINVESSHIYPDFKQFLSESYRVLKPGGLLCFTDFRDSNVLDETINTFEKVGFKLQRKLDISSNVKMALECDSDNRKAIIRKQIPRVFQTPVIQFAGIPGSKFYNDLSSGSTQYISVQAIKPK